MGPSPLHGAWAALDPDAVVGSIATPKTRILKDARGVGDDVVALGTDRCVIDGLASRHCDYTESKESHQPLRREHIEKANQPCFFFKKRFIIHEKLPRGKSN